jgi:hypothetical protein
MIYSQKSFVDTSQIINDRTFYRESANSPLISEPKSIKETPRKVVACHQIKSYWQDSASILKDELGSFSVKWQEPLSQLISFVESDLNPELERPTPHSLLNAVYYLFAVFQIQPDLPTPELAMSGDGGIYLEWQLQDKFVSIQIKGKKGDKDRIYVEQDNHYGSTEFSKDRLKEVFGM